MSDNIYKQQAAEGALDMVASGMRLGLGSGSTSMYMVQGLAARLHNGRLHDIAGVPTSELIAKMAQELGIPLLTLEQAPQLDMAIDGADEIDPQLNLIKGLGGAMLREKIVAASARQFVIIAGSNKYVTLLGQHCPVPVEVITFGLPLCTQRLSALGARPVLRRISNGETFITDEGNVILDCHFESIPDPAALSTAIKNIPGVAGHGLFVGIASCAVIAGPEGIRVLRVGDRVTGGMLNVEC